MIKSISNIFSLFVLSIASSATVNASGMKPETSVVFIYAADDGGTINVTNTDAGPALLYTTVRDIDTEYHQSTVRVVPTQPIIRVEGGKTQQVRFALSTPKPMKVQQLKRVVFEGITERKPTTGSRVNFTVRQDLPLIIHPKGLPDIRDPWTKLTWSVKNGTLTVSNDTPYIVRFGQEIVLLPSTISGTLDKAYILPGQSMTVVFKTATPLQHNTQVKFSPATRYGSPASDYIATIKQ